MDLNNVLHTHIDGIGCTEKFLETSQLKFSFQNHHFLHILVLFQTSDSVAREYENSKSAMFARLVA